MFLWDKVSITKALGEELLSCPEKLEITSVVFDSRRVIDHSLFVAKKGEKNDGNDFISNVLESYETTYVMSSKVPSNVISSDRIILVRDVNVAYEKLALYRRYQLKSKVICITGSLGKTTTKELCYLTLSHFGKASCNIMSFNNYSGLIYTMVNTPVDTEYAIYEVGIDECGQMLNLAKLVKPNISIITNIEKAHLGNYKNLDEIAFEKSEILKETSEYVILNRDNKYYDFISEKAVKLGCKPFSFGSTNFPNSKLLEFRINDNLKSEVKYSIFGKEYKVVFNTIDKNIIFNSMSVLTVCKLLDLNVEEALSVLSKDATSVRGRNNLEVVKYTYDNKEIKLNVINGVYNAVNPKAFDSGFEIMKNDYFKNNRKVCIFGAMAEAGSESKNFHLNIIEKIKELRPDVVVLFCPEFEEGYKILLNDGFDVHYYSDADDVIADIKNILNDNDLVFIKSSKGKKSYKIFNYLSENNKMDLFL